MNVEVYESEHTATANMDEPLTCEYSTLRSKRKDTAAVNVGYSIVKWNSAAVNVVVQTVTTRGTKAVDIRE